MTITRYDLLLCMRCEVTPADDVCCSSHGKVLCHECYRRTHFVEVCAEGCSACAREGLPVILVHRPDPEDGADW